MCIAPGGVPGAPRRNPTPGLQSANTSPEADRAAFIERIQSSIQAGVRPQPTGTTITAQQSRAAVGAGPAVAAPPTGPDTPASAVAPVRIGIPSLGTNIPRRPQSPFGGGFAIPGLGGRKTILGR